jgi:hypothetical protein
MHACTTEFRQARPHLLVFRRDVPTDEVGILAGFIQVVKLANLNAWAATKLREAVEHTALFVLEDEHREIVRAVGRVV